MEEGQSGTDDSEDIPGRKKMEGLSLQFATPQSTDLSSSSFLDTNNISLHSMPFAFTGPLQFSIDDLSNMSSLKDDKDNFSSKSNSQFSKMSDNSFVDGKGDIKSFERSDLGMSNLKGMSPSHILSNPAFQDACMGQPSPASSTSQTGSQVLRYQTSGAAGDAMLSAINYNDSEILTESAFEMNTTNSAQLDEGIMGNPSQNIPLPEGQGSHTYELFDGNVNETLALSPQPFADSGFGVGDNGNLSATTTDSEGQGSSGLSDQRLSSGSPSDISSGKKGKNRPSKSQIMSPLKQNVQCPTCGKGFNNSSALAKHRLTHSEERKYVCQICSKGFKRQDHLNGHLMTHREKKPYECQVENCEKSYCDARSLRRHLEAHHHQSPEDIATSVLAAMKAAGITNNNQPNGKPRAADQRAFQEATQVLQMASPPYSANTTPSPSPSYTTTAQQFFQFDQQPITTGPGSNISTQPAPKTSPVPAPSKPKQWQERSQVYNFVNTARPTATSNNPQEAPSPAYSPVSPVPPSLSQPTSPLLAQHQRQLWFNNTTPADMAKQSEEVVKPPVTCSICEKKFKNIPALNGHMRLHGGYMKKDNKEKDDTKKSSNKNKNRAMKPPPPRPRPSANQTINAPQMTHISNVLPSLSQSLQLVSTPQYTTAGQNLPTSQGVQPHSVQQQPVTSEHSTFLRQQHPILQQQLQLHTLPQPAAPDQQHQQQQQQQQQNMSFLDDIKPSIQTSGQQIQVSDTVQGQLGVIQQPTLLHQVVTTPEQLLLLQHIESIQLLQQQQQLQPVTVQSLPAFTPQQLEMLQQLHPSQIQQLIQEHHLQQQQQEEQQQQQIQQNPIKTESPQVTQAQSVLHDGQVHIMPQIQVSQSGHQQQFHVDEQQLQQFAEQIKGQMESSSRNNATIRNQLEQGESFPHGLQLVQQGLPSLDGTRLGSQQQQQDGDLENIELNQFLNAASIQSALGLQFDQRQSPSQNLSSAPVSYLSQGVSQIPSSNQNQDLLVAQFLGSLPDVIHLSSQANQVSDQTSQENKLSNIHPTIQSLTSASPSSSQTIDSITRELMASRPKPVPRVFTPTSSSGPSVSSSSQNFKPIRSSQSEYKRRSSMDSERTISPKLTHNSLTMLLTKGAPSETFAKPKSHTDFSTPSGRVRMRSKSGDDHIRTKLMRSKSVDQSLMRPRSRTEDSLFRARRQEETLIGRSKSHSEDVFSKSDGASVFRNPGLLTSPIKFKRKHRPAPLFIPPHLNSFQSRLRSPRLWDGGDMKGLGPGHTPPPYTPPPMLSPVRRSSGLFCSIHSSRPFSPRSAPITPRLHSRRSSLGGYKPEDVEEEVDEVEPEEETPPPETDIQPHVNIGPQFQASLPVFNSYKKDALRTISREDVMWEPFAMSDNTDDEVQNFQKFACSAAVNGNGSNIEYSLHILYMAKGNIQNAVLMLMEEPPKLPSYHTLLTYNYQESDAWATEEIESFHKALHKFDKDFFSISKEVATKNVKQCVQFYYLWKKVCPEDYRRLRIIRRKREQEDLYNLRSRQHDKPPAVPSSLPVTVESETESSASDKTEEHMEVVKTEVVIARTSAGNITTTSAGNITTTSAGNITTASANFTTNVHVSVAADHIPVLTIPSPTSFTCDYPDCHAAFSSKQALSGHRRMHSTSVWKGNNSSDRSVSKPSKPRQPKTSRPRSSATTKALPVLNEKGEEIFPCKLCDRVFSKVKSRSAHMKSHKMAENERSKSKPVVEMMPISMDS